MHCIRVQEGGRGIYRFSEGQWRPLTAPEARREALALHKRFVQQPSSTVLPRVTGKHVSHPDATDADGREAPSAQQMCNAALDASKPASVVPGETTTGDAEPYGQAVRMIDVDSGPQASGSEDRRPLTAAGSSVYATAMRQLESEQRQMVRSRTAGCTEQPCLVPFGDTCAGNVGVCVQCLSVSLSVCCCRALCTSE